MKSAPVCIILLSLYAFSLANSPKARPDNPVVKNLNLDQEFADYINNQLKTDDFDQVIIWADTILVDEKVTFQHADLVLISNYFSTGNNEIGVMPVSKDSSDRNLTGQNGKNVDVIARQVDELQFYLPGGGGLPGQKGRNGKNGKKSEAKPTPQGASLGTPGANGKPGGNGGSGGKLVVNSFTDNYEVNLRAPGGKGGSGGKGGKGGTSYVAKGSKIINPHKPNEKIVLTIGTKKEKDGQPGKKGTNGKKGTLWQKVIDEKAFDEQIRHFFAAAPDVLDKTGWQIILKVSGQNHN